MFVYDILFTFAGDEFDTNALHKKYDKPNSVLDSVCRDKNKMYLSIYFILARRAPCNTSFNEEEFMSHSGESLFFDPNTFLE